MKSSPSNSKGTGSLKGPGTFSRDARLLLRVLDANFNRAKEALRVGEDLARFVLDSKPLAAAFKKTRHQLSGILLSFPIPYGKLLASRDSARDVSKSSVIQDTRTKPKWQDLMTSNLKRAQEALRVLEECSKIISAKQSAQFQKLRFEVYELEKRSILQF